MIEFDRDLLQLPLKPKTTEAINVTVEAVTLLAEKLSEGHEFGIETLARRLDISVRTLQRRLDYCGVDFEDLIDETRRNEAISLVHQGDLSITDIAFRLG